MHAAQIPLAKKNVDILMQVPLAFGSVYCAQKYVKGLQELKITMMTVMGYIKMITTKTQISLCRAKTRL